ncbi:MAG: LacI family DNA-binding transcriptional regulator [Eubacterium sp.]|nr:LacI family DNA-binding transcriptional regulator [Eubacterium sp.]
MATIKDVANDAGVAVGTVSKVLNGLHVSEENKKKVEASVAKLGYQMNYYARGLRTNDTYTIAVIVPDILNPFFACLVFYIEKELYQRGYKMFLCQSQKDVEKEVYYFKQVYQNRVDGIIGVTYNESEPFLSKDIPMVIIDRHFKTDICCVSSDNFHGGELAVEHLLAGGSSRLLFIRTGSKLESETLKRGQGFEQACLRQKVAYDMVDFGDDSDSYWEAEIFAYLKRHFQNGRLMFDGIYTSTDGLALAVLELLRQMDIQVPRDVQLVGHDGLRRMNRGAYMLSSIAQPVEEMAVASVENVIQLIHKEQVDHLTILPVTFVYGGTTRKV